jgi:hypothetical protein
MNFSSFIFVFVLANNHASPVAIWTRRRIPSARIVRDGSGCFAFAARAFSDLSSAVAALACLGKVAHDENPPRHDRIAHATTAAEMSAIAIMARPSKRVER